jgi:Mlc titration factor MtfA (ptsG expression regulator)
VVLSWEALGEAGHVAEGGINVVIHEFAHKLDMRNGEADGVPPLHAGMDPREWKAVLGEAWEGFCDAVERGRDTWLDPYGAEDPAEFFAVASEAFFEAPQELRRRYPRLYGQFVLFYRQDPASRGTPA